ncbi:MAG TPA: SMC-Scp complex subunit ScpB [Acidobacteriota bacterium]|nr:SMC-Scp complex subunit ScpB [Acidobacteriota bacterium]
MNTDKQLMVEAILFAAGTRISVQRIMELSKIDDKNAILETLNILKTKHDDPSSSFQLTQMGEDWKMTVKREFLPVVEKIAPDAELAKSVIETLAILAWKAPMTQSDLVKIRSNKAYDHLQELKDRGFIAKEKKGRSFILKLTPKFFEYFDIRTKKQVDQLFDKYENKANIVAQKKIDEFEEKKKKALEDEQKMAAPIPEDIIKEPQVTIRHIKDEERKTQKDFFDSLDAKLAAVQSKTNTVKSELSEFKPQEVAPAQPAAPTGDGVNLIPQDEEPKEE